MFNWLNRKIGFRLVSKANWEFTKRTVEEQAARITELEEELNDIRCNFDVPPCEEVGYKIPWDMTEFIRRRDAVRNKQLADLSVPITPEDNLGRRVNIAQFVMNPEVRVDIENPDYALNEAPKKPDSLTAYGK